MARPKRDDDLIEASEPAPREPWAKIRVKHYKVFTSQGRAIAGQLIELPAFEAKELISKGHAVAVV
jgi:hypothetical protein